MEKVQFMSNDRKIIFFFYDAKREKKKYIGKFIRTTDDIFIDL